MISLRSDPEAAAERLDGHELALARIRRKSARVLAVESEAAGSSNAGIVLGDERVLLFDTRVTPAYGDEFARTVVAATGARVEELIVVNSHFHGDHVFGNGAFRGATIVATASAQAAERREWERQVEIFEELRPHQAEDIRGGAKVTPTIGVTGPTRLDLGGVEAELEPMGPAHTEGDLVLTVPGEGVSFVADLAFNGHWPSMWNADLRGWLRALRTLRRTAAPVVVPGHGPPGGPEMFDDVAASLRFLIELEAEDGDEDAMIAASPFAAHLHPARVAEGRQRVREQMTPEEQRRLAAGTV
ncbi:Glyoxylase, beta-lactamase superfamily II [Actinomadura meyerae]|uniref:Glyoxylase, beta-lactamase superfamily II n=1 Tax=Actinomadura meyerae TaxID=240840 RepID=A0A239KXZ6_9ACTN|nr:Glyoxylase, beta-lactamase superfamily II [Actinomadura meyerae]